MRLAWMVVLSVICSAASCGGGQTGDGPGGFQCTVDEDCARLISTGVEGLDVPAPEPAPYETATCRATTVRPPGDPGNSTIATGVGPASECVCETADGTVGFILGPGYQDCLVHGRARGCLYGSDEFPGCDPGRPESCDAICADLTQRTRSDAMRVFSARVRSNRCLNHYCQFVVEIDGTCFANNSTVPFDCGLSDDAILELSMQ